MSKVIELSLDNSGRILIPPAIQQQLSLSPGETLIVEQGDKGEMWLRPQVESPELIEKDGILVVRAEPLGDLGESVRRERDRRVLTLIEQTNL